MAKSMNKLAETAPETYEEEATPFEDVMRKLLDAKPAPKEPPSSHESKPQNLDD